MERSANFVADNIDCLKQGISLLQSIDAEQYRMADSAVFGLGGVGKHFRHIMDFYACFLYPEDNVIDYERRERDSLLETDKFRAEQKLAEIILLLDSESAALIDQAKDVSVTSAESSSYSRAVCTASTIGRELQFLISHTIHHYAIIALMLRGAGIEVPEYFGVAPSTIRHLKTGKV